MKLTFAAATRLITICSGKQFNINLRIVAHCGEQAQAIIIKLNEMSEVAFAYQVQSEVVGDYRITQEVRDSSPWFEVQRLITVSPAETIEVVDATEAMEICKARSPEHGVSKTEGGKRNRVDASGKLYTCGRAPGFGFSEDVIDNTLPVIAFFSSRVLNATLA